MGRGQEVTSSRSGWGECGRHARERHAHAPGPAPPLVGRRRAAAGQGEGDRAGGAGPTAGCLRPAALASVPGGRPGLRGPRGARPLVRWLGPGDGLLGNQTVAIALEPKPGGLEKQGREL